MLSGDKSLINTNVMKKDATSHVYDIYYLTMYNLLFVNGLHNGNLGNNQN
ncbi:hypothetical protein MMC2321_00197 [Chitinophaga sp. MM2321]